MIDTQNPDAPRYPVFARSQDEVPFGVTPSQTVGPYVHIGLLPRWENSGTTVPEDAPGRVDVSFTVLDGAGQPIVDAMIETWQADAEGRFDTPADLAVRRRRLRPVSGVWHEYSPTTPARSWCTRSSPALSPRRTALRRRPTSTSVSSPAECSSVSTPVSTFPRTPRLMKRTPSSPPFPKRTVRS